MGKRGLITIGVITTIGVGVYFYFRLKRDKFKKDCLSKGGTLRGDWQCDFVNNE